MMSTLRFSDACEGSASLSPCNSGGICKFFTLADSGGQITGVTRAVILIFSTSVDNDSVTRSYVFLLP